MVCLEISIIYSLLEKSQPIGFKEKDKKMNFKSDLNLSTKTFYNLFVIVRKKKWYEKIPLIGKLISKFISIETTFLASEEERPKLPKEYDDYIKIGEISEDFK